MKIAIFGQYYQNNTHSIVEKVVAFLEQKNIADREFVQRVNITRHYRPFTEVGGRPKLGGRPPQHPPPRA